MNNINDNLVMPISDDLIKALRKLENVVSNGTKRHLPYGCEQTLTSTQETEEKQEEIIVDK